MICVNSVSIYPNALTLKAGETYCEATVQICPTNATNQTVIWKTNNPCVATVNPSGHITAVAAGTAIITAESSDGCGIYDTCTITVIEAIPVTSVEITDYDTIMKEGSSAYFAATVSPDNATNKNVVWTSSNEDVATVHPQSGLVYAKNSGTVSIIAAAADDCNISDCITVTVTDVIKTDTITMNSTSKCLEEGDSFQLTVSICPTNVTNTNISWYSSDTNVATVCNGTVYAVSKGSAVITAAATDGSGVFAECAVTVTDGVLVKNVSVSPSSAELFVEESMYLTEEACPPDATNKCVYWESSNPEIASVAPPSGLVIAHSVGTARIYAKTTDGSDKFAYCTVTVKPIEIESIALENVELPRGTYASIARTILPKNATNQNLRWCSSNENIVEVDEETGCIYGKSEGITSIYAFAQDGSEQGAYCTVTVTKSIIIDSVSISPSTYLAYSTTKTIQLEAIINPGNALVEKLVWKSDDTVLATVDQAGLVTLKGRTGTVNITVKVNDICTGTCKIIIDDRPRLNVKSDNHSFFIEFPPVEGSKKWFNIGCDLSKEENRSNVNVPNSLIESTPEAYEQLNDEEKRYLANMKNEYTEQQIALIYLFDPLGVEYFLKYSPQYGDNLVERLIFKDNVFKKLYGKPPQYYDIQNGLKIDIDGFIRGEGREDVVSQAEALFGYHKTVSFDWQEFVLGVLKALFELFEIDFSIDLPEELQYVSSGVEVYQQLYYCGAVLKTTGQNIYNHIIEYSKQGIQKKTELWVRDRKMNSKKYSEDEVEDIVKKVAPKWTKFIFFMLDLSELIFDCHHLNIPANIPIYNRLQDQEDYFIVFSGDKNVLATQDLIDYCR